MVLRVTDEMHEAIAAAQGRPIEFHDERTSKKYLLVASDDVTRMFDDWVGRSLQVAFEEADRGQLRPWDPERIKAEGRRRLGGE